jgi:membrane-bound lytic murein transglycosylase
LDEPIKNKVKPNDTLIVDLRHPTLSSESSTSTSGAVNSTQTVIVHIGEDQKKRKSTQNSEECNTKKQKISQSTTTSTNSETTTTTTATTNRIHTLFDISTTNRESRTKGSLTTLFEINLFHSNSLHISL